MKIRTFFLVSQFLIIKTIFANPILQCDGKQIWGSVEKVNITNKKLVVNAKLDTGATISSFSATQIQLFNHSGQTWVRFKSGNIIFNEPVVQYSSILMRAEENSKPKNKLYTMRPVIVLPICIGNQKKDIRVNLTDRSNFRYPLLLGKDALAEFHVLVDVSRDYLAPSC